MSREEEKILALAKSFRCLREKGVTEKWDSVLLSKSYACWSPSEADCARFVLAVWNHFEYEKDFSVMTALSRWDREERDVFTNWAKNPWWC